MSDVLDPIVRASAMLAAALVACRCLPHGPAALRHMLIAAALFAAVAIGPLGSVLPPLTVTIPSPPAARASVTPAIAPAGAPTTPPSAEADPLDAPASEARMMGLVVAAWVVGMAVSLSRLVLGYRRLLRVARSARPLDDTTWTTLAREAAFEAGIRRPVTLLTTDSLVLAAFGISRPRILVPEHAGAWTRGRIRSVLDHEMAHVARRDPLVQTAAEIVLAILWYNPLAWLAVRRLRLESERACDDAVLRRGMAPREYAAHLIDVARACRAGSAPPTPALSMARHPDLHARISAMLNSPSPAQALSRRAVAFVVVALAAMTVSVAAVRLAPEAAQPLRGAVYDPSGALVPDAAVTLAAEGQAESKAMTDAAGRFEFPQVAPGRYVLGVALPGFKRMQQPIALRHDGDWDRSVVLQLGDVQETITIRSARLPAPQPSAAPARVRVGGKIGPPSKLRDQRPVYPESMRAAGIEGTVALEAIIGRDGSVQSARVVGGLVHPDLATAAIDAVRQWKFEPTTLNGAPVEVVMNVAMTFELEK